MKKAGTFFEVLIVIVIVGVLTSGFSYYYSNVVDMWQSNANRSEIGGQLRLGMMRVSRDVRRLISAEVSHADEFAFTMLDENDNSVRVRFRLVNDTLLYELDNLPAGSPDGTYDSSNVLLDGITSLVFTYFDQSGAATSNPQDVYFIDIGITMKRGTEEVSINPRFFPRNFM